MDSEPCSSCHYCDFLTFSHMHLEKHTQLRHNGLQVKSDSRRVSLSVSQSVRQLDALFQFSDLHEVTEKSPVNDVPNGVKLSLQLSSTSSSSNNSTELDFDKKPLLASASSQSESKSQKEDSQCNVTACEDRSPLADHERVLKLNIKQEICAQQLRDLLNASTDQGTSDQQDSNPILNIDRVKIEIDEGFCGEICNSIQLENILVKSERFATDIENQAVVRPSEVTSNAEENQCSADEPMVKRLRRNRRTRWNFQGDSDKTDWDVSSSGIKRRKKTKKRRESDRDYCVDSEEEKEESSDESSDEGSKRQKKTISRNSDDNIKTSCYNHSATECSTERKKRKRSLKENSTPRGCVNRCSVCNQAFTYNKCLEKHMKQKHNEQHWTNLKVSEPRGSTEAGVDCIEENLLSSSASGCTHENENEMRPDDAGEQLSDELMNKKQNHSLVNEGDESFNADGSKQRKRKKRRSMKEPLKCNVNDCGMAFSNKKDLRHHLITSHKGKKLYKCVECGKIFHRSGAFHQHMRTHAGEKSFKCEECDKAFLRKCDLRRHMRRHTGEKPFQCKKCGKAFYQNNVLRVHMRRHTGEKPFQCEGCGKLFCSTTDLQSHMVTHMSKRPYKCNECGQGFRRSDTLANHVRRHTGEKPHKCEECGKAFIQQSSLIYHRRSHTRELKTLSKE